MQVTQIIVTYNEEADMWSVEVFHNGDLQMSIGAHNYQKLRDTLIEANLRINTLLEIPESI